MAFVFQKSMVRVLAFILLFSFAPQYGNAHPLRICKFDQIYQLGDSISDTGNLIREFPVGAATPFARLPYGETFFKNATGRCSNGLLMIDFFAMAAGLPLLPPYKNLDSANFRYGVNFAVAGSTALSSDVLANQQIISPVTTSSLNFQLDWMMSHFDSICINDRDCNEKLRNALFMVGEIGGNDYNYAILQGKTVEELTSMVANVVDVIMNAAKKVIDDLGAARVVIPGNFPIGCLPIYKTVFQTNTSSSYDDFQCLSHLNDFAKYHNQQLQEAIQKLKEERPNVVIVYGDYYHAYQFLLKFAKKYGIDTEKACCGIGGKYNFNLTRMCGVGDVPICDDPQRYMSWDGIHLTQKGYKIMASWLLHDIFPKLHCHL